ncbi:hypothetical protein L596_003028 [Steinernema carpocapsae]|uniref:Uncharacterized protein n=1 Tax=Steinernema carpocapsae TaxID=34508 RepID=A0A4U8UU34_STECR|nr:hypothetical protein L596_003028 [Steinernema carpocapsae]
MSRADPVFFRCGGRPFPERAGELDQEYRGRTKRAAIWCLSSEIQRFAVIFDAVRPPSTFLASLNVFSTTRNHISPAKREIPGESLDRRSHCKPATFVWSCREIPDRVLRPVSDTVALPSKKNFSLSEILIGKRGKPSFRTYGLSLRFCMTTPDVASFLAVSRPFYA